MKGLYLLLLFLLVILLIWFCIKTKEELEKEQALLKLDEANRNSKLKIKEKRKLWIKVLKGSIKSSIAFAPYLAIPDLFIKLSFSFSVLFLNSTDIAQTILDNMDKHLARIFYGTLDSEINQLNIIILTREKKIKGLKTNYNF